MHHETTKCVVAPPKLSFQLKPANEKKEKEKKRQRKKGKLSGELRFGEVILMINNYKPRAPFGTTYSAEEERRVVGTLTRAWPRYCRVARSA